MITNKKLVTGSLKHKDLSESLKIIIIFLGVAFILYTTIIVTSFIINMFSRNDIESVMEISHVDSAGALAILVAVTTIIVSMICTFTIFLVKEGLFRLTINPSGGALNEIIKAIPDIKIKRIIQDDLFFEYNGPVQSKFTISFTEGECKYVDNNFYPMNTISKNTQVRIPLHKISKDKGKSDFYLLMDLNNDYKYIAHIRFDYDECLNIIENSYRVIDRYTTKQSFDKWCQTYNILYN